MPNPVVPHSAFAYLSYVVQYAGGCTHNATDVVLKKLTTLNGHNQRDGILSDLEIHMPNMNSASS